MFHPLFDQPLPSFAGLLFIAFLLALGALGEWFENLMERRADIKKQRRRDQVVRGYFATRSEDPPVLEPPPPEWRPPLPRLSWEQRRERRISREKDRLAALAADIDSLSPHRFAQLLADHGELARMEHRKPDPRRAWLMAAKRRSYNKVWIEGEEP